MTWTGGSPNDMVKVSLIYQGLTGAYSDYAYVPAGEGSFSSQPLCSGEPSPMGNGVYCTFVIPAVTELLVEHLPTTVSSFQAPGITGNVQVTWTYRYIFDFVTP
jgi:hypothetical protein